MGSLAHAWMSDVQHMPGTLQVCIRQRQPPDGPFSWQCMCGVLSSTGSPRALKPLIKVIQVPSSFAGQAFIVTQQVHGRAQSTAGNPPRNPHAAAAISTLEQREVAALQGGTCDREQQSLDVKSIKTTSKRFLNGDRAYMSYIKCYLSERVSKCKMQHLFPCQLKTSYKKEKNSICVRLALVYSTNPTPTTSLKWFFPN